MKETRVKICGITRPEDARLALAAGADALGMVFYEASPRAVDIARARAIAAAAGPFVTLVGLFVNAEPEKVRGVLAQVPVQLLQFHGDETPAYCEAFERPYIKAIRMRPGLDLNTLMSQHPRAQGFLLDAYRRGVPGGTGETFDWQRVPRDKERPIILAGGLTPDNVAEAVTTTAPYAVDVSGGVEASPDREASPGHREASPDREASPKYREASPGHKDAHKLKMFIHNAKHGATGDANGG